MSMRYLLCNFFYTFRLRSLASAGSLVSIFFLYWVHWFSSCNIMLASIFSKQTTACGLRPKMTDS